MLKIFIQLNITFQTLLFMNTFITVRPSNILIKYCNPEKTNFDSFFSDYFIYAEETIKNEYNENNYSDKKLKYLKKARKQIKFRQCCNCYIPSRYDESDEEEPFWFNPSKFSYYLYSLGLTIYYLYFGKLPYSQFSLDEYNNLLENPQNINVTISTDKNLEDLINKILKKDVKDRINWHQYFLHPFFKQYNY